MTYQLTCTCTGRFSMDYDHDHDCDLWLVEEFFCGWLAWDPIEEVLYQTESHPNRRSSNAYVDYDTEEYEWSGGLDEQVLAELSQEDRDIALTTDMFIERMTSRLPEDEDDTWVKNEHGHWVKAQPSAYSTTTTKTSTPDIYDAWNDDWAWGSDRHCEAEIYLPSGDVTVFATSAIMDYQRDRSVARPVFGLYADDGWAGVEWVHTMLPWQDFGLPTVPYDMADHAIKVAYTLAKAGQKVEVGCIGAHGRTGTILACMAVLDDPFMEPKEAVNYIRGAYCHHAVESVRQEWYVERFHATLHCLPIPAEPAMPAPMARVVTASPKAPESSKTDACNNTPLLSKPQRKKSRRSRRGGKRN